MSFYNIKTFSETMYLMQSVGCYSGRGRTVLARLRNERSGAGIEGFMALPCGVRGLGATLMVVAH